MKIRAIAYFLGLLLLGLAMLVGGGARGQGVLPANNGVLNVGRTLAGDRWSPGTRCSSRWLD